MVLLFLFLSSLKLVYAADDATIDLASFDDMLAEKLGIDLFAARTLASTILLCLFLFPTMMICGYFGGFAAVAYSSIVVGVPVLGICIALGWLPVWVLVVIVIMIALLIGSKIVKGVAGET